MPGWVEILIVLVIVILLFGPGRIGKVAGELGKGIRDFKKGINGEDEEKKEADKPETTDEKKE
jgi:sec-independent protein translocase protein TatA